MIIVFEEPQVNTIDGDYIPADEELSELFNAIEDGEEE